jgi:prepilin-type N-terminal cleavage/methylation domain-containing protein
MLPIARHPSRRSGYTLFEMLLVMALLVALMAMSFPTLARLRLEHQLKQGAELVRLEVASTRLHALESGMDYQFRYEPNGKHFVAVPAEYLAIQAQAAAAQNSGNSAPVAVYWKSQGEFTVKVKFSATTSNQQAYGPPQPLPKEFLVGFQKQEELSRINWAPPLIFKADGSARDFAVEIENEQGKYVVLSVRGITGGTTLSPVLRRVRG